MSAWTILEFAGQQIRRRDADGYLSATDMCRVKSGKVVKDFLRLKITKEHIAALEDDLKVDGGVLLPLVEIKKGNSSKYKAGTWVHPRLATYLAMWISPRFSVKVTRWVEEWKASNLRNAEEYKKEICTLVPSKNDLREKELQNKLQQELGAHIEVKTPAGYVDLVTEDRIIELKEFSQWKHALGQVLCYGRHFPGKQKYVYLFGDFDAADVELIKSTYADHDVELVLYE